MPQLRHDGFIGEGTLYIRRLDRADLGLIPMGNATSFSVAVESEVKERLSKMRENYGAVLNTVILPKSGELKNHPRRLQRRKLCHGLHGGADERTDDHADRLG